MAHNLNFRSNGIASFASKREKAWHGLGTIVEAMNSKEAIILGGLDFSVKKVPIYYKGNELEREAISTSLPIIREEVDNINTYSQKLIVPSNYATIRTDTNDFLGIVGERYHIIQNIEAFEFIDSIIGEGKADYETVGCLGKGETIFITCKLKEEMIINKDLIDKYLLLSMSHDGSSSITVMFTPIRVVCNNTLSLALEAKHSKISIRHTKSAKHNLELAKKVLGIVDAQTRSYQEAFGFLYNKTIRDSEVKTIIQQSFKIEKDSEENISTRGINIINQVNRYYYNGVGQEEIVGNAWGVFNGITGYLQNVKTYSNSEIKFKSTFMTTGVDIRNRAFNILRKWN